MYWCSLACFLGNSHLLRIALLCLFFDVAAEVCEALEAPPWLFSTRVTGAAEDGAGCDIDVSKLVSHKEMHVELQVKWSEGGTARFNAGTITDEEGQIFPRRFLDYSSIVSALVFVFCVGSVGAAFCVVPLRVLEGIPPCSELFQRVLSVQNAAVALEEMRGWEGCWCCDDASQLQDVILRIFLAKARGKFSVNLQEEACTRAKRTVDATVFAKLDDLRRNTKRRLV